MAPLFSTIARRMSGFARWLKSPVLAFFIVGDVFLFGYVALHRSEARTAGDIQIEQDIDQQDHAVCTKLGLTSGSAFDACAQELARVRQRHEERLGSDWPF
jgi:hypothetical protein